MDLALGGGSAAVACDRGTLVALDLASGAAARAGADRRGAGRDLVSPAAELLYVAIAEPDVVRVVDKQALVVTQQVETERDAHISPPSLRPANGSLCSCPAPAGQPPLTRRRGGGAVSRCRARQPRRRSVGRRSTRGREMRRTEL